MRDTFRSACRAIARAISQKSSFPLKGIFERDCCKLEAISSGESGNRSVCALGGSAVCVSRSCSPASGGRGAFPEASVPPPGYPTKWTSISLWICRGENRRSEEHTSELQSRLHLVCRLLLGKKKKKYYHPRPNPNPQNPTHTQPHLNHL